MAVRRSWSKQSKRIKEEKKNERKRNLKREIVKKKKERRVKYERGGEVNRGSCKKWSKRRKNIEKEEGGRE